MRRLPAIGLLLLLVLAVAVSLRLAGANTRELIRLSDNKRVTLQEAAPDLAKSRIIFVGESHDNKADHAAQLEIIRALQESGVPVAIGLEMFRKSSQEDLDRWTAGSLPEARFHKVFRENWGGYWRFYTDIAAYAREKKIPMVGLNIPREISQQVASGGFSSLSPEQASQLPDVQCNVTPEYRDFIRQAFGAHHHHSESSFTHFCEAQLVWDTAMAVNLIDYLNAHPKHTMVVLAGNGHAWKPGIPDQVRQRSQLPFRVILPEIPGQLESESATTKDADYLVARGNKG